MRPTNFQGNIHILNFPAGTAPADLAALFDEFGIVMGAQIKTIPSTGGILRMGIVAVAPDKAADKAIAALQGYQMGGLKLKMRRAKPVEKAPPKPRRAISPHASQNAYAPQPYSLHKDWSDGDLTDKRFAGAIFQENPRKVIVEYKKRRSLTRI